jgi:hypothetical protein
MIEFYTTMRVTGRCPGVRCNEGWVSSGSHQGNSFLIPLPASLPVAS